MNEIEQLRKEVSELRARLAKLEDQHPRVVGPAVAGLPSLPFPRPFPRPFPPKGAEADYYWGAQQKAD